jgi:hypothetical protein
MCLKLKKGNEKVRYNGRERLRKKEKEGEKKGLKQL